MLSAIEAPLYDVGVLGDRGMLPGSPASRPRGARPAPAHQVPQRPRLHIYIRPSAEHRFTVLDDLNEAALAHSGGWLRSLRRGRDERGNFQAWLKHSVVLPKLVGSSLLNPGSRYNADPSAADWRRFGRLPGFTNCKPKYRKPDGHFPFVRLISHGGKQYRRPRLSSKRSPDSMK